MTAMYAAISVAPGAKREAKYKGVKSKFRTYLYHSILNDLRTRGVTREIAESASKWASSKAKLGDRKWIEPGILIEIVGVEDE